MKLKVGEQQQEDLQRQDKPSSQSPTADHLVSLSEKRRQLSPKNLRMYHPRSTKSRPLRHLHHHRRNPWSATVMGKRRRRYQTRESPFLLSSSQTWTLPPFLLQQPCSAPPSWLPPQPSLFRLFLSLPSPFQPFPYRPSPSPPSPSSRGPPCVASRAKKI